MLRRSGRNGVPQLLIGDQLVIGFDRPRIEALLNQARAAEPPAPSLGVRVADAAQHAPNGGDGAYVGHVRAGSLADKAGVQSGDVIISLDGQAIHTADDLIAAGQRLARGRPIPVTVIRDSQYRQLTLVT